MENPNNSGLSGIDDPKTAERLLDRARRLVLNGWRLATLVGIFGAFAASGSVLADVMQLERLGRTVVFFVAITVCGWITEFWIRSAQRRILTRILGKRGHRCHNCGYPRKGMGSGLCPECGAILDV